MSQSEKYLPCRNEDPTLIPRTCAKSLGAYKATTGGVKTGIKLMIHMDSEAEALHALTVLAEGGTVLSPLRPHPEPDDGGCGSLAKDRFGYTWIITCPNPVKQ